jgi:hypothetical protein
MHAVIPRGVDWLPVPSAESIGPELRGVRGSDSGVLYW